MHMRVRVRRRDRNRREPWRTTCQKLDTRPHSHRGNPTSFRKQRGREGNMVARRLSTSVEGEEKDERRKKKIDCIASLA